MGHQQHNQNSEQRRRSGRDHASSLRRVHNKLPAYAGREQKHFDQLVNGRASKPNSVHMFQKQAGRLLADIKQASQNKLVRGVAATSLFVIGLSALLGNMRNAPEGSLRQKYKEFEVNKASMAPSFDRVFKHKKETVDYPLTVADNTFVVKNEPGALDSIPDSAEKFDANTIALLQGEPNITLPKTTLTKEDKILRMRESTHNYAESPFTGGSHKLGSQIAMGAWQLMPQNILEPRGYLEQIEKNPEYPEPSDTTWYHQNLRSRYMTLFVDGGWRHYEWTGKHGIESFLHFGYTEQGRRVQDMEYMALKEGNKRQLKKDASNHFDKVIEIKDSKGNVTDTVAVTAEGALFASHLVGVGGITALLDNDFGTLTKNNCRLGFEDRKKVNSNRDTAIEYIQKPNKEEQAELIATYVMQKQKEELLARADSITQLKVSPSETAAMTALDSTQSAPIKLEFK